MTATNHLHSLPYIDTKHNLNIKLLVVEPCATTDEILSSGLIIPEALGQDHTKGTVIAVCEGSTFKIDDEVIYRKIDRTKQDAFESLHMSGKDYDIIAEQEVWNVNERPYNRVYIEPLSEGVVSESGLIIPANTSDLPQKGVVFSAPENFFCKEGDIVEYRKNEKLIYHTADVDGKQYDVLYDPDIFTINGKVSPYRIIIKIDKAAQAIKRRTADSGILLSPIFTGMLFNLQYGVVMQIGSEAQKNYPDLEVGDTAILHHSIEAQPHRLLSETRGKHSIISELRMIDVYDPNAREIFGVIRKKHVHGLLETKIVPFGKNVFMKWDISLFGQENDMNDKMAGLDCDLNNCRNLEELKTQVAHKIKEATDSYKAKFQGLTADAALHPGNDAASVRAREHIGQKVLAMKESAEKIASFLRTNFLVKCTCLWPKRIAPYVSGTGIVITTHKELYPINLMGTKYLIAHADYLLCSLKNADDMFDIKNARPIGERVVLKPLPEDESDMLIIPESSREKPQKAEVILVGNAINKSELDAGDIVYHRKLIGVDLKVNGVDYLLVNRNDIFLNIGKQ